MFSVICCFAGLLQVTSSMQTGTAELADTTEEEVRLDTTITVSIHPSLPRYYIHVTEVDVPPEDETTEHWMNYELKVRSKARGRILQTIEESARGSFDGLFWGHERGRLPGIYFDDVNFDGYLDLQFYCGADNHGNSMWAVYVFNQDSLKFVQNEQLSRLAYGAGLDLDPAKKQIQCDREGWNVYVRIKETYQAVNNAFVLIKSLEVQPYWEHPGSDSVIVTKKELINGVLTQTGIDTVRESETD